MKKQIPRKIQSMYIAIQTLISPRWKKCSMTYAEMTRKIHMENRETFIVWTTSPAQRMVLQTANAQIQNRTAIT